ncbi:hypothetical protein ACTMTF_02390 [Nonomuraea sp. ZG12]|uniref:hypothetical protein n=1 Tax=Nonomuraea sp. ZG12 TaxID=3452207 RepID=UPI003F89E6A6
MLRRFAAIVLILPALAACQQTPAPGGMYSTGGDTADDPCARVVSAIGYAGLLLGPEGSEQEQEFEDALLGRLSEVRGITLQYGSRLPASLSPAVRTVQTATEGLARADVPRQRQVALLKRYRAAAGQIRTGCT